MFESRLSESGQDCSSECVTSVNWRQLTTIRKLLVEFVIDFHAFPFEAHVIEDLTCDLILGRDFLQKFCFTVDFENGTLSFFPESDPFPFAGYGELCVWL